MEKPFLLNYHEVEKYETQLISINTFFFLISTANYLAKRVVMTRTRITSTGFHKTRLLSIARVKLCYTLEWRSVVILKTQN